MPLRPRTSTGTDGPGFLHALALVVLHRANLAPLLADDEDVALAQGAVLHQNRRHRAAADIELRLDHRTLGGAVGVGLQFEDLGLQRDRFQKLVEPVTLDRRNLDVLHVARHLLDDHLVLKQVGPHLVGVGIGAVDLVDRHDHRHLGRLGVVDRLDGLRHHRVVGGHHKHHDIGHLRAAGPHRGEGGVARRVEERQDLTVLRRHLVGADVLGDAAGLAGHDLGIADRVEKRGLAVVDVAHHGDHRRARLEGLRILVLDAVDHVFDVGVRDAHDLVAEFLDDQFGGIGVDGLVLGRHDAVVHQRLDDIGHAFGHPVGKLGDHDRLGQPYVADDLLAVRRPPIAFWRARSCLRFIAARAALAAAFAGQRLVQGQLARAAAAVVASLRRLSPIGRAAVARRGLARAAAARTGSGGRLVRAGGRRRGDLGLGLGRAFGLRDFSSSSAFWLQRFLALALFAFLGLGLGPAALAFLGALRVPRPGAGLRPLRSRAPWRRQAPSSGASSSASGSTPGRESFGSPMAAFRGGPRGRGAGPASRLRHDHALALDLDSDVLGPPVAEALLHLTGASAAAKAQRLSCRQFRSYCLLRLSGGVPDRRQFRERPKAAARPL